MRIDELSIGDWVYYDDIVFGREIAKIHQLNKDKNGETIGITVHRSDGAFGVVGYILTSPTHGDLRPIRLTPAILEKNGFEKNSECCWRNSAIGCACLRFGTKYWDIRIKGRNRAYRPTRITIDNILHTHQLQHALRLAGVEKEIEV